MEWVYDVLAEGPVSEKDLEELFKAHFGTKNGWLTLKKQRLARGIKAKYESGKGSPLYWFLTERAADRKSEIDVSTMTGQELRESVRRSLAEGSAYAAQILSLAAQGGDVDKTAVIAASQILDRSGHPPERRVIERREATKDEPEAVVGEILSLLREVVADLSPEQRAELAGELLQPIDVPGAVSPEALARTER